MFFRPTTTTPRQRRCIDGQLTDYLASWYLGSMLKAMWSRYFKKHILCNCST